MKRSIEENKQLCKEMPFLIPKNRFNGKAPDDYDYSYTELDAAEIPIGWEDLFFDFCKEIAPIVYDYTLTQVKEKYGTLRVYSYGKANDTKEYDRILRKYTELSEHTCCMCGSKNATMRTDGWICPWCDDCYDKRLKRC